MKRKNLGSCAGITLPELLMVVVVMAVAAAMAFPQMRSAHVLRHKALAYDSLKVLSDAFRKYDQEFDADILGGTGPFQAKLQEISDKGFVQVSELYQNGQCYSLTSRADEFEMQIQQAQGNGCSSAGVVYKHGFKVTGGRAGEWLSYEICNASGTACQDGPVWTYESDAEKF